MGSYCCCRLMNQSRLKYLIADQQIEIKQLKNKLLEYKQYTSFWAERAVNLEDKILDLLDASKADKTGDTKLVELKKIMIQKLNNKNNKIIKKVINFILTL